VNRFLVSMPDSYIKDLDRQAKQESRSRSDIIRELVKDHFERRKQEKEVEKRREAARRDMDRIRALTKGSGFSGSDFIREWRYRDEK